MANGIKVEDQAIKLRTLLEGEALAIWLERNPIMAIATALISLLFNVTLSRDVPFHQLQQLPCLHHGSTKA